MSLLRHPGRYTLTACLALLALAFTIATTTIVFRHIGAGEARTRAAAVASTALQNALVALLDEDTGVRAYMSTGQRNRLKRYESGLRGYRAFRRARFALHDAAAESAIASFAHSAEGLQPWYVTQINLVARSGAVRERSQLGAQLDALTSVRKDQAHAAEQVGAILTVNRRELDQAHATAYLLMTAMGVVLVYGGVAASLFAGAARDNAALARRDVLTSLPNRRAFDEKLDELLETRPDGGRLAVLYTDLDGFKAVNDRLGHAYGDRLLASCAERIRRVVRPGDFVARIGGDEFTVLLAWIASRAEAEQISDRIASSLEEPFVIGGSTVRVSASIGIALIPDDAQSAGDLMRTADEAMYHAKRTRRTALRE